MDILNSKDINTTQTTTTTPSCFPIPFPCFNYPSFDKLNVGEVMDWVRPLLELPDTPFELYTAPPRQPSPANVLIVQFLILIVK